MMVIILLLVLVLPKEEVFYGYIPNGAIPLTITQTDPSQVTLPVIVGKDTIVGIMNEGLFEKISGKQRFVRGYKRDGIYYVDLIRDAPFPKQVK